jgi:hypothetical protein
MSLRLAKLGEYAPFLDQNVEYSSIPNTADKIHAYFKKSIKLLPFK